MTRHLVSTPPQATPCRRCRRLRFTGLDQGLPYRVDPAPLTPVAELVAVLNQRHTYEHVAGCLVYRDHRRIRHDLTRGRPLVYADHRCHITPTAADIDTRHLPLAAKLLRRATTAATADPATDNVGFHIGRDLGSRVIVTDNNPPF